MALGALAVSSLGTIAGGALGGALSDTSESLKTTKQTTTTKFLDPAQLQQILSDLTQAESTARGDINSGFSAALGVLQGDPNRVQREQAIQQQAQDLAIQRLAEQRGSVLDQQINDIQAKLQENQQADPRQIALRSNLKLLHRPEELREQIKHYEGRLQTGNRTFQAQIDALNKQKELLASDPMRFFFNEANTDVKGSILGSVNLKAQKNIADTSPFISAEDRAKFNDFTKEFTKDLVSQQDIQAATQSLQQSQSGLFQQNDPVDPFLRSNQEINLNALNQLSALSGIAGSGGQVALSPQDIQARLEQTPGFQFRRDQGQQAVERSASARGLLESGAVLKGLTEFGQGLASQEFGAEHARLAKLAGLTANAGLQGASQQQQLTLGQADLLSGQGSQLAGIAQQAATQRGNALLGGGTNTQVQNQAELFRGLNRV